MRRVPSRHDGGDNGGYNFLQLQMWRRDILGVRFFTIIS